MVKLLDCTTRDGGYDTNWTYSDEYVFNLIYVLNQNGINYFEIGYRNYYENEGKGPFYHCSPEFLKKFYEIKGNLFLGVMTDVKRFNESDFLDASDDYIDFVRVAVHPDRIKDALSISELLDKRKYAVMLQLMEITNLNEDNYELLANFKNKSIFKTVYLADTYGTEKSENIKKHFDNLREKGYKNISFHAHNQNGQALNNSLAAVDSGAYSIDVVQDGIGRNGGNLKYSLFIEKFNNYVF
ncbi:hypothetical protein IJI31_01500 [bacterium]|nr:hypothetical protein [bacterium]